MRAAVPKTRYVVGYMAAAMKFLSLLPTTWADALLRAGRKREVELTKEEVDRLKALSRDYFKL